MPNWVDATAMLSDASRYNGFPLHMAVHPSAFFEMSHSGRYLLHVTDGHKTLEYQHPSVTIWLHRGDIDLDRVPERAAATWGIEEPIEHEEVLTDARVTIRVQDTGEAGRLERDENGVMNFIRTEQG